MKPGNPLFWAAVLLGCFVSGAQAQAPTIVVQPTNEVVLPGSTTAFSVVVSGTGPFTYRWQFNGRDHPYGIITTVAGNGRAFYSGDGGAATNAAWEDPFGVAVDASGNLFIVDSFNNRICKVGTDGIITTLAGNGIPGYSGDGGGAANAELNYPSGVAVDAAGNLFIADTGNYRIREVRTNGIITTVAGNGTRGYSGDGGPATKAELDNPTGVAVDASGNLFIADSGIDRIREVGTNGIITTVAGNGTYVFSGDGGPAANAELWNPEGVAVDASGNLFIADQYNNRIRQVGTNGIITTVAGNGTNGYSGDGGPATSAELSLAYGPAVDASGNLFIADSENSRIREVGTNGIITTVAGNGTRGYSGDGGAATSAELSYPMGVAVDAAGNLFIADNGSQRIREVVFPGPTLVLTKVGAANAGAYDVVVSSPSGSVTSSVATLQVVFPPAIVTQPQSQGFALGSNAALSVAATGSAPLDYQWFLDGAPLEGQTNATVLMSAAGFTDAGTYDVVVTNLYGSVTSVAAVVTVGLPPAITAQPANRSNLSGSTASFSVVVSGTGPFTYQWQFNGTNLPYGVITTVAGNGTRGYSGDGGPAASAELNSPQGVAVDASGNLFIADQYNCRIREVATNGIITTVAGNAGCGYSGDGGPATGTDLSYPTGVAVDASGNLFIADSANNLIREVGTNGIITTVAGNGTWGYAGDGGPAAIAELCDPSGVAVDASGNLFIADYGNNVIREVGTNGIITTVAGNGTNGHSGDGGPATNAELYSPQGVAVDASGNLFIADNGNQRIREVGPDGTITTVAGNGTQGYSGDGGPATEAELSGPNGVAVDVGGNLFIADAGNNRIREVGTDGIITTVAGNGTQGYSGDGGAATSAELRGPAGVAVDALGNLFIADANNHRVREVIFPGPALVLTNVGSANAGSYDVVVSSPYGSITSSVATLAVLLRPSIALDPQSQWVAMGSNATLSVAATGAAPLDYQWYLDDAPLEGQTNTTLLLSVAGSVNAGSYSVVVTNLYGSATSAVAVVAVGGTALGITAQPASRTNVFGSAASFSVAVSGTGPFTYRWQFNGTNLPYGVINTVAGTGMPGYSGDGGAATNAELWNPYTVAVDASGNLFIADTGNHRIREVRTNGIITTVAELNSPYGVAVDASGNLFIADYWNSVIREVGTDGIISTVAGNGSNGYSGDSGAAAKAELSWPNEVAVDASGNLFIADNDNQRIREVGTNGIISTVAGNGTRGYSGEGGPATNAELDSPQGVAVDASGNLFIADNGNQRIREVGTDGVITTVAGNGTPGYSGDGGPATEAELSGPAGVAVDVGGNLFIADAGNNRIREVGTDGIITTVAGNGTQGYSGDGGPATQAELDPAILRQSPFGLLYYYYPPIGVAVDASGNLFIADAGNSRIRKVVFPGPTLVLTNVGGGNAGSYDVVVSSRYGSITSNVATLLVLLPPGIAMQPQSQWVTIGSNATLSVAGTGAAPLDYQWYLDGAPLEGQTNTTLLLSAAGLTDAGAYNVVVTNLYGSVTSAVAVVTVGTAPGITAQPASRTNLSGSTASFSVAVSGTGPLTYQWQFNGTTLPSGVITTVAGSAPLGYSGDGGPATHAALNDPFGVAVDAAGNLFIADLGNARIREVGTNGIITTVAGNGTNGYSGDGGAATNAELYLPNGVAVDAAGNLFIADSGSGRIREVGTNGIITTVAGNGTYGFSGDGGAATNAGLWNPQGVAVDAAGNLFIADSDNNVIREVGTNGIIATVAGNGTNGYSGDGGPGTSARLSGPIGVAVDTSGNLFIADSYNRVIREARTNGVITTVAGNGTPGYSGDGGAAISAQLSWPACVAVDASGNLFIVDYNNNVIRKVGTDGTISTVAGNGTGGYSGDGGPATHAALCYPFGVAVDASGDVFIADNGCERISRVVLAGPALVLNNVSGANAGSYDVVVSSPYGSATSSVATLLVLLPPSIALEPQSRWVAIGSNATLSVAATGTAPLGYQWYFDGAPLEGQTNTSLLVSGVAFPTARSYNVVVTNLYGSVTSAVAVVTLDIPLGMTGEPVSQTNLFGSAVSFSAAVSGTGPFTYQWQFNGTNLPSAIISTVAGNGTRGYSDDGGPATSAELYWPYGVAVDASGNLLIADSGNNVIRKVGTDGIITTVAGNGAPGYSGDGGAATSAELSYPTGVAVDAFGNLFIADQYNRRIREVGTDGIITTVAGNGTNGYSGDGGPATSAELSYPTGVAVDASGNLFIADQANSVIREVGTDGIITTVAGNGTNGYVGDGGPATSAELWNPQGVAVDASGNLFIADSGNRRIREVGTDGLITTVAGNGTNGYAGDGGPAASAELSYPSGVAVDASGNLFIADEVNNVIREVGTDGIITTVAANGAELSNPHGVAVDASGNLFIAEYFNQRIREVVFPGPRLVLTNVGAAYAGSYDVVVSDPYDSVTSSVVTLVVLLPPSIAMQPQSQGVAIGSNSTLSVAATGPPPLEYQWYLDGAALEGQTNTTLPLSAAGFTNAGSYSVVVTNLYGSVTSAVAVVTVDLPSGLTQQPASRTNLLGSTAAFSVAVSGTGPFAYQWQFNGTNLPYGVITTVAGNGTDGYSGDGGPATKAELYHPSGVAVDASGNLFIADYWNSVIREVGTDGIISTVAGNGSNGYSGDSGAAAKAELSWPNEVAVDASGNLFIADSGNNVIREVGTNGIITTVAGNEIITPVEGNGYYAYSGDGGPATSAELGYPSSVAVDASGNLFIADSGNQRIREVGTNGIITTVAGNGGSGYSGDGGPATSAQLWWPACIAVDASGNLFIADANNNRIRKVGTNGIITTVAGNGTWGHSGDGGVAANAQLNNPSGVAVDALGNLFIADSANNRIRQVGTNGIITTVAGNGTNGYCGDGGAAAGAELASPWGVAVDASGNLFIADDFNNRIREVVFPGPTLVLANVAGGNAGAYDVVVSSPYGSVTSSVVTLAVALNPLNVLVTGGQEVQLQFQGVPGNSYVLLSATDLTPPIDWQPVSTNAAGPNGQLTFTVTNALSSAARFYRMSSTGQ